LDLLKCKPSVPKCLLGYLIKTTQVSGLPAPFISLAREPLWPQPPVPIEMIAFSPDRKFSQRRLRWLIAGTAAVIATIVAANAMVLAQMHASTLHDVAENLLRQSLTLSELVEHTFQSADLVLANVVERVRNDASPNGDLSRTATQEFYGFLAEKKSELPQIDTVAVLDRMGMRPVSSRGWPVKPADLSSREYFRALRANPKLKLYVSQPLPGFSSGTPVSILARPVRAKDGSFLGVVLASTDMAYFDELFHSTALGEGYGVTLLRRDGALLTRYPAADPAEPIIVPKSLKETDSAVSPEVRPNDQQALIAAAHRLADYPLTVIVTQTEDAAFRAWRKTALTMGFVTAALIALVVMAAIFIARSWKQQDRLDAARAEIVDSEKTRMLAEAELNRQRDLAEQSMRLNAAVDNMTQGLCMFDKDGGLVVCNDTYVKLYRLPAKLTQPGTHYTDIVAYRLETKLIKNDAEYRRLAMSAMFDTSKTSRVDEHSDGRLVRITRQALKSGGWVSTHEDITEQQRAAHELDQTKRFLDSIIENIPISVIVKDAKTLKFVLVNRAFEMMHDTPRSHFLGHSVGETFKPDDAARIHNHDIEALAAPDGIVFGEQEVNSPHRGKRVQATSRIVLRDGTGEAKYLIVVIDDITERRKTDQRIAFLAHHDALTGLANRAALTQKIEDAAARQRRREEPFSVLLLDLDRFKQVNDTLGHPAGDTLLTEVAARLNGLIRETDTLARLGGDEFAVVQAGETHQREAAAGLANRIIEALSRPFDVEGADINIGASIGIALAPEHDTGSDNLLKMADLALYRAKSSGGSGYRFFDPEMSELASARHETEVELRRAITQNELELHYQPIIDTKTRRIFGAEALVRWRHPTKGLIFPDKFIPLAEETGLITQIGEWVLNAACAEAVTWPADIKVAVNLSLVQFRKSDLSDTVMRALAASGLPPERLELEITETALIESAAECLPALRHFKNIGITIVLDDFGTGYSSLSQLAMFPFDKIKIDKSFTQNLTKRSECAAIISATLTLAENLNIATTAEGVETVDQYRILRLAGVTSLQGYLFKRPGPAAELDFNRVYDGGGKIDAAA
jgi:diguanylate cyclase (GGDEF)-like protein/PAS domain S-box-containing protein